VVTAEELAARAQVIRESPELRALLAHLRERAQPLLQRLPPIPEQKALLSVNGGVCPEDGTPLAFDPWSPHEHKCPHCGKTWRGERHDLRWARYEHLWFAERAAHLATLAAVGGSADLPAAARAREILTGYAERYWRFPNRDNVLGPSRLFFSTYMESLWICNYVAAATLLRAAGALDETAEKAVNQVAEEAATLIGEFDEGFSNRQTWNDAALAAVAVWFEDEELAQRAIEGDTGLIAHLVRGYGRDGMWYEGENYHLFALRGLLTGAGWARLAGVDFTADERLAQRLHAALRATALSALPDFSFPARKDARFGVSLAQPAYLELWEIGISRLGETEPEELSSWLNTLYRVAKPSKLELLEYYLHEAPVSGAPFPAARSTLSWWSLLEMLPDLPPPVPDGEWHAPSILLESQGLAVMRQEDRYASLECGPYGGGHGHPDRLHLTLHAGGVHWLPDSGTGTYVARDLFWYRSTLAHNAPRLDRMSQPAGDATCQCFDDQQEWAWVRGRFGNLTRIIVAGPRYLIDVLEMNAPPDEPHVLELPWHVAGRPDIETTGRWEDAELADEFVMRVKRFRPDRAEAIVATHIEQRAQLTLHMLFDGALLQAEGPGLPGHHDRVPFYVMQAEGPNARFVTVLEPHAGDRAVRAVRARGEIIEVETHDRVERHRLGAGSEWMIESDHAPARVLRGGRAVEPPFTPLLEIDPPTPVAAPAFHVAAPPALDGTLDGFELGEPLDLSSEDQYRRSEDGYPGPEEFSAAAYAGWDERALYIAVDVTKPDVVLRPADAAPLLLDNEPDDIHSDGLQVYLAPVAGQSNGSGDAVGYLVVPDEKSRRVRVTPTTDSTADGKGRTEDLRGGWRRTDKGYCATIAIPWPAGVYPHAGARVRFDLIINEMLPGRMRRTGQLVWSGGGGWIWLRGDRQSPARFGILELVG
jgi:hypothetical protein